MKKIPLHSMLVFISSQKSNQSYNLFDSYEILTMDSVLHQLTAEHHRYDLWDVGFEHMQSIIKTKLNIGERVVVEGAFLKRDDRIKLTEYARSLGIPIYYIIDTNSNKNDARFNTQLQNVLKEIMGGDSIATVCDISYEKIEIVRKLSGVDLIKQLKLRGYNGITAIGDIHGMLENYKSAIDWATCRNTFIMSLGDILDYGPSSIECIELSYELVVRGKGVCVIGNHERKILKWLEQSKTGNMRLQLSSANKETIDIIESMSQYQRERFENKFRALINLSRNHWVFGNVIFTHGAIDPHMYNIHSARLNGKFETLALFGEVDSNNRLREDGYPNRTYGWVDDIPNNHIAIVGHDIRSTLKPHVVKGSLGGEAIFMDTGCGKGGRLSTCDLMITNNQNSGNFGLNIQNFNVI